MNAHLSNEPTWEDPPQNNLGLASFIISIVGLFAAGLLCPVGAVLGIVAMGKQPRGFAIAGFIIGLIGSFWICLVAAIFIKTCTFA